METMILAIFTCILLLSRDKNLLLENLALRLQLAILKQKNKRHMGINEGKTAPHNQPRGAHPYFNPSLILPTNPSLCESPLTMNISTKTGTPCILPTWPKAWNLQGCIMRARPITWTT
jgi:hypothetical protein